MFNIRSRRHGDRTSPVLSRLLTALPALATIAAGFVLPSTGWSQVFRPPKPVTYTEKYELYGGFSFLNGQAGQNLPKRFNMGGGEIMATDWLTPKIGIAADVRYEAGTTPVLPGGQSTSPRVQTRPLVSQFIGMGGVQYHLTGNRYAGINLHALGGVTHGSFDHSNPGLPDSVFYPATGLYTNRTSGMATAGGSIDFNQSARFAIRISPEIVFEHFGNELREFASVSGGIVYRFGDRR